MKRRNSVSWPANLAALWLLAGPALRAADSSASEAGSSGAPVPAKFIKVSELPKPAKHAGSAAKPSAKAGSAVPVEELVGFIVKVQADGSLSINLSARQGVAEGDVFDVVEQAPERLRRPGGEAAPGEKGILTQIAVRKAGPQASLCKLAGRSVPLRPGMRVQRKSKGAPHS